MTLVKQAKAYTEWALRLHQEQDERWAALAREQREQFATLLLNAADFAVTRGIPQREALTMLRDAMRRVRAAHDDWRRYGSARDSSRRPAKRPAKRPRTKR